MGIRNLVTGVVACCALQPGPYARADIAYDATPVELPYRVTAGSYGFVPVAGASDASASLVVAGDADVFPMQQSTIGYLGPVSGIAAQVAPPALTDMVPGGVAAVASPEPIIVAAGERVVDSLVEDVVQVFSGTPLVLRSSRKVTLPRRPQAAVFTRVATATDFDLAVGGPGWVGLLRGQASTLAWQLSADAASLAVLPAAGPLPKRIVAAGNGVLVMDAADGRVIDTFPGEAGRKVLAGNLVAGGAVQFVVLGTDGRLSMFDGQPSAIRWRSDGDTYISDFALGDRDGDGLMDVLATTTTGDSFWLNGSGARVAPTGMLPFDSRVVVAKVDGAPARVVAMSSEGAGSALEVRSLDLATTVAKVDAQQGPFDRIAIGDVDNDGDDDLVSIAGIPWGYGVPSLGRSGRLSIRDVATGALTWRSAIPAGFGPTSSDVMLDVAIGHVWGGTHRQIVVLARDATSHYEPSVDIVDGTTHAAMRMHLDLGGRDGVRLRLVDVDGDGIDEIVVVSVPLSGDATGVRVHVLRTDTLAWSWTSPVLTPQYLVSSAFLRPVAGGAPHLVLTVEGAGVWSVDLAAHVVDYSVPIGATAATLLSGAAGDRIAIVDSNAHALVVVDATNGVELERIPLPDRVYHAIAAMPNDAERVTLAAEDHLETWNIVRRQAEGPSPRVGDFLGNSGTLLARAAPGGATFYAGNATGIWAFPTRTYDPLIFIDGFEP